MRQRQDEQSAMENMLLLMKRKILNKICVLSQRQLSMMIKPN